MPRIGRYNTEFETGISTVDVRDALDCMLGEIATEQMHDFNLIDDLREKPGTGSVQAESGFIPEGAIGQTVGLSYGTEVNV